MQNLAVFKDPKALFGLLKETYHDWSEDKASRLAAALAYYTAFSIAPLLLISIAVAGLVFGREAAQGQIFAQLNGLLGSDGASAIQTGIANSNKAGAGTLSAIIGLATLIWSASSLFGQLQEALNTIWEVQPDPHAGLMATVKRRFLSMTMVLGIAFILLVSLVLSAGLSAVGNFMGDMLPGGTVVWQIVNFVISFGIITALFAAIRAVMIPNEMTKLTICQTTVPPGSMSPMKFPTAERPALKTSDTSRMKAIPSTIVIERNRRLMVARIPAFGSGWTSQMVFRASCNWPNRLDALQIK